MPRVLLHAFSTFKLGGPQARFVQLANAFGPAYRHVVVAMDGCFDAGERLNPDVDWHKLPLANRRGSALANRSAFRDVLKRVEPDLLLSYNWGAIEWAAGNFPRRVPQVHVEDGFGPEEATHQLPRRVWTRRVFLGLTRTPVVVASRHLQRIALEQWGLSKSRVRFIANGVESVDAVPQKHAESLQKPLTIGTVAGLRREKNLARLLRAFAAVRARQSARLVIVGDGPERGPLQDLAAELGVEADVEFAGYLKDPQRSLREFDLFALSSDTEQLPISMLEAMACGLPVVATSVGDVAEVMPQISHVALAEPSDASFEAVLLRAIERRAEWPAWREANLRQVRAHYSLEGMLGQWDAVFQGRLVDVFPGAGA